MCSDVLVEKTSVVVLVVVVAVVVGDHFGRVNHLGAQPATQAYSA